MLQDDLPAPPPQKKRGDREERPKNKCLFSRGQFKYHVGVVLSISGRGVLFVGLSELSQGLERDGGGDLG